MRQASTLRVCQSMIAATYRKHLGDVHVKEADGIALEALALGFVPFDIR